MSPHETLTNSESSTDGEESTNESTVLPVSDLTEVTEDPPSEEENPPHLALFDLPGMLLNFASGVDVEQATVADFQAFAVGFCPIDGLVADVWTLEDRRDFLNYLLSNGISWERIFLPKGE